MKQLLLWVTLLSCAMLQAVIPAWAALGQAKAPLLLAGVLYFALTRDELYVVESAVLAGLLQDSLGPIPHGASVFCFLSIGLLVHHYRERVFAEHWFTHMMLGFAASVFSTLFMALLLLSTGQREGISFGFVLSKALGMSILSLLCVPLLFRLLQALEHSLGLEARRI